MTPSLVFSASWALWAVSWVVAALWSSADTKRQTFVAAWLPYTLIVTSIVLPIVWRAIGLHAASWWLVGPTGAYCLAFATIPGFLFAWWARLHLGALWSVAITRKADHRLIDSGPYAIVRHPIYTGILWSALVTDIASATTPALLSLVALWAGFWLKARAEERFLAGQLGKARYRAYSDRVPMLIPRSRA